MAYTYGAQQQQCPQPYAYHSQYNAAPDYAHPLNPMTQATSTCAPSYPTEDPPVTATYPDPSTARFGSADARHKRRMRILKAVARVLATIFSLATWIPLALTLVKYFSTRDEVQYVDGETRTAWALGGSVTWYAYVYFGVASVTLMLNGAVLVAYCCCCCCSRGGGVARANAAAEVEGWWSGVQRGLEGLVWVASVAVYRYGKEPDDEGKFRDLWGWTCSPAAWAIQDQIDNVDYDLYCDMQTVSFYTGILNVLASILTGCLYLYAIVRWRSKSRLRKALTHEDAMEPLRP